MKAQTKALSLPTTISECDFLRQVIQLAHMLGWLHYHTHNSLHSAKGFPDLVFVRGERLIFAELKTAKRKLTPEQKTWIESLSDVPGIKVYVWRPADINEIARVLR